MQEYIEEVDWKENIIAVHPKEKLKEKMFPHKVSLIIPRTPGGLFALCRRAVDKHPFPDTWCCAVGGKVLAKESFQDAAKREMKEEIKVNTPLTQVAKFAYNKPDYQAIFTVFTTKYEIPLNNYTLDPTEIQYVRAFTLNEIKTKVRQTPHEFAPTFLAALEEFSKNLQP